MPRLNIIEIDTPYGLRSFELHQGDITQLDERVDLMVVSAFDRHYAPTPGTVIGAFHERLGISIEELAKTPELDFRDQLGCWVSRELNNDRMRRLVCVEGIGSTFTPQESIQNLFALLSLLEAKDISTQILALPLLGAGNQRQSPDVMIEVMLRESTKALTRLTSLQRVLYVTNSAPIAKQLDDAMNEVLGRVRIVLPRGQMVDSLRERISQSLSMAEQIFHPMPKLFADLRRILIDKESRSFEIGVVGRRLAEMVVADLQRAEHVYNLSRSINNLAKVGVANWVRCYLHVLRTLGNESAHEGDKSDRIPASVCEDDMALFLACVQRVLDFWLKHRGRS